MTRRTAALVTCAATLLVLASCSDDNEPTPTGDTQDAATSSTGSVETVEGKQVDVVVEIGPDRYEASQGTCAIDEDTDLVSFIANGTSGRTPIRIEYGDQTGKQLVVAIDVENQLDTGTTTWIGRTTFEIDGATAIAEVELTKTQTGDSAAATATVRCS